MKKVLSIILIVIMLLAICSVTVFAENEEIQKTWNTSFDEVTGILTVSGTGRVEGLYADDFLRTEFDYNYESKEDLSVKKIIIEEGITCIAISFSRLKNLEEVVLPNSLVEIEGSFNKCENLASINIPSSVQKIWNDSFCYCDKLSEITFNNSISIGVPWGDTSDRNFYYLPALKDVTFRDGSFLGGVFNDCKNLRKIILEGVVEIGEFVGTDAGYYKTFSNCHDDLVVYVDNYISEKNIINALNEGDLDFKVVNISKIAETTTNSIVTTEKTTKKPANEVLKTTTENNWLSNSQNTTENKSITANSITTENVMQEESIGTTQATTENASIVYSQNTNEHNLNNEVILIILVAFAIIVTGVITVLVYKKKKYK